MTIVLAGVVVFVISILCLFLVVQIFGSSQADFKTVAAAAAIMTVVSIVLAFIPFIGWIASLIVNIVIVKNVMECSTFMAFLAIILWGGLTRLVITGMGLSVGAL